MAESDLEAAFLFHWRTAVNGPAPEREYRFDPTRRWRVDFSWPASRVAVECEGGHRSGGRHVRGDGFEADAEKYNNLAARGWLLFRFTGAMLVRDPVGQLAPVLVCVLARAKGEIDNGH